MSQPEIVKNEYDKHKKKVKDIDIFDGVKLSSLQGDDRQKRYAKLRTLCKNVNQDKGGSCIEQVRAGRNNYKCSVCLEFEEASY